MPNHNMLSSCALIVDCRLSGSSLLDAPAGSQSIATGQNSALPRDTCIAARGGGGSAARLIRSRDSTPRELADAADTVPGEPLQDGPSAAWQDARNFSAASGAASVAVRTIRSNTQGSLLSDGQYERLMVADVES